MSMYIDLKECDIFASQEHKDLSATRNISVDVLKVICMMMVIILHVRLYGIEDAEIIHWSIPYWIVTVGESFSIVAVNVFVLISGYYCCEKAFNYKKLVNLWLTVEVFSVGLYLLLVFISNDITFSWKTLIRMALPVFTNQYWFFSCYLILMIVSPILNDFIAKLSELQFRKYLIILIVIFSVVPTINIFGFDFGVNSGYSIIWFVLLYFIASYFRKYPKAFKWGRLYLISVVLLIFTSVVCTLWPRIKVVSNLLFQYNSVIVLLASVGLFCFAVQSNYSWNKRFENHIKKIVSVSFGVYLLHEHGAFRGILWHRLVRLEDVANEPLWFVVRILLTIICVFIVGCLLDAIIQKILFLLPFNKKTVR